MTLCPISYKKIDGGGRYSLEGLKKLSPRIDDLNDFPFTTEEQVREAAYRASRMSIQGVQPKLSAVLSVSEKCFTVVDTGGTYILKPQNIMYPNLPENEDLTMRLAGLINVDVPFHGLIYCKDGSLTYFIRRFDRITRGKKLHLEDFAQLGNRTRDTKYDSSMEQVAKLIETCTTFPVVEKAKLFKRIIFNFICGNEDMHLKNFSVINRQGKIELSPAYDFLNTTIVLRDPDEMALPVRGKKKRLTRKDLVDYFAQEGLGLTSNVIDLTLGIFKEVQCSWEDCIDKSFLPDELKEKYHSVIRERLQRLDLT